MFDIIKLSPLTDYGDRQFDLSPMVVTAHLHTGVIATDNVYFDNLIAKCLIDELGLAGMMQRGNAYDIPLPIKRIWTDSNGLPLWAASTFFPIGKEVKDRTYLHKRLPRFWFSDKQPKSSVGRWMERRVSVESRLCPTWKAFVYGDKDEIARMLCNVRFLGKRRTAGYGEVEKFTIQDISITPLETMVYENKLIHAIPSQAMNDIGLHTSERSRLVGWTPPQWKPDLFTDGFPVGTTLSTSSPTNHIDYWAEASNIA